MTLGQLKRMLAGARSQEQGPGTPSPLQEPRPAAPVKDLQSWSRQLPSPSPGLNPGQGTTRVSLPATLEPPNTGSRAAAGPLACLGHRQEARLPFSKFLDEVTMRVLDPETLEAFRGPRAHSPGLSSEEHGPGQAAKPLVGTASPEEKAPVGRPQLFPEMATGAADTGGRGQADTGMGSRQRRGCAGSPRRSPGQLVPSGSDSLQPHIPPLGLLWPQGDPQLLPDDHIDTLPFLVGLSSPSW
ncbi:hypothetical protein H920_17228 [Fukomys damarensis]|uniref:Uncharacterized protein n=1 Tax=Fukomys damarensis TaxID=885580 RepID=A0A091CQA9_FUKDA|nr:hypothetical protein H920_17228 [Fukomys damarensis]